MPHSVVILLLEDRLDTFPTLQFAVFAVISTDNFVFSQFFLSHHRRCTWSGVLFGSGSFFDGDIRGVNVNNTAKQSSSQAINVFFFNIKSLPFIVSLLSLLKTPAARGRWPLVADGRPY